MFYAEVLFFGFYSESFCMPVKIQHNKAIILVFLLIHFTSLTFQQCICMSFFSLSHLFLFRSALRVWFYLAAVLTIGLVIDNMFNYCSVDSILRYLSKNYLNGFVNIIIYTKHQIYSCCASLLLSQTYKTNWSSLTRLLFTSILNVETKRWIFPHLALIING